MKMKSKISIALVSFLMCMALLEIVLHILLSPEPGKNRLSFRPRTSGFIIVNPNIVFDSVRGYRFINEPKARYCYFVDTSREIDFTMHVNNQGYASKIDFQPRKLPGVKRYLVFGDSFSAGVIMDTTWVDWLNILFAENNQPLEFYNFSVDGGGMANWWSIYCNEIMDEYEFDGVILAPYIDNINRGFVGWWQDSSCIKGAYFPSKADFTRRNELGSCCFQCFTSETFDRYQKDYFAAVHSATNHFFVLHSLLSGYDLVWGDPYVRGQEKYYSRFIDDGKPLRFDELAQRYKSQNLLFLDSLVADLR